MIGVKYVINGGVVLFVACWLGTGFYGDADGITLKINDILRIVMMASLGFLWQYSNMVSILVFVYVFLVD